MVDFVDESKRHVKIVGDFTCGAAVADDGTVCWWTQVNAANLFSSRCYNGKV